MRHHVVLVVLGEGGQLVHVRGDGGQGVLYGLHGAVVVLRNGEGSLAEEIEKIREVISGDSDD